MSKRPILIICIIIIDFLFFLLVGPLDVFTHGFYTDEIDASQIEDVDIYDYISVNNCEISFSPKRNHFAGFELFLVDHSSDNGGIMTISVSDENKQQIDLVTVDLCRVKSSVWYKVYTNADLRKGEIYTVRFSVSELEDIPNFLIVNPSYLSSETVNGNVLINYAYAQSTFSFQEKVLLSILIVSLAGILLTPLISQKNKKRLKIVALFLILTTVMAWNYMYNSFDTQNTGYMYNVFDTENTGFLEFQNDSETYVTGPIYAAHDGIYFLNENEQGYGMGRYYNLKGPLTRYSLSYITDDNWVSGYNRYVPAIVVDSNIATREVSNIGYYICFSNGEEYQIIDVYDDGVFINIYLNAERLLSPARNGNLDDVQFYDDNHTPIEKSLITAYQSQYGLQGKVFRHLAEYMDEYETLANLHLICAIITAIVFVFVVMLLALKFNYLYAGIFYFVFALSPWTVNFAKNLYWVEFTWFVPLAIGLVCSLKVESFKWRISCYIAMFIAISGKCLCGYEYISAVMMGSIAFLGVDFIAAFVKRDNKKAGMLFKSTFFTGVAALLGFIAAIIIHASLRGSGNIFDGIQSIIENDVLRRTNGADLNSFDPIFWPSMNASVWEVYSRYFHFPTEVVTGVTGNLFPLLCIAPSGIFAYEINKKKVDYQCISMYIVFFLTSISWFCLAKSHSYIHTHMNYVLWYFGFIQVCFYVVISRFVSMVTNKQVKFPE